jgi:5-(carboxyamino)imidazole ribonucleotide synthase
VKIGIIGGGQLAQMMALAAHPLGLKTICLEPTADCPASLVTTVLAGSYDDPAKLAALATATQVLTYEFENISAAALKDLENFSIYPPVTALAISQDRLQEKQFFDRLPIPTTQYAAIDSLQDLKNAVARIGLPAILKTRRMGYDGKGQFVLKEAADIEPAWKSLAEQPLLLENKIAFDREVSCIAVRSRSGQIAFYDLIENQHKNGILHLSQVNNTHKTTETLAQQHVTAILTALNYVGVLTVEFFEKNGVLIANEIAPRVHNSGHWTIEGAVTSQFENHLRAVCGLPLGITQTRGHVAMLNLVGELPDLATVLKIPYAHYHTYSKTPRANRKLGHITLCAEDKQLFDHSLKALLALIA